MPKTPTQWTPESNQPSGFTPLGSGVPTVFTDNDGSAPTAWTNGDTKNPVGYTPVTKTPALFSPTFGTTLLTYDTLGASYDDASVTYDQLQQNQPTPAALATAWSLT